MAPRGTIAFVDTAQMIEVDRAMVEDFHIGLMPMMENAGRHPAQPKTQMREPGVKRQLGEFYVADSNVLPGFYASPSLGLEAGALLAHEEIASLW